MKETKDLNQVKGGLAAKYNQWSWIGPDPRKKAVIRCQGRIIRTVGDI